MSFVIGNSTLAIEVAMFDTQGVPDLPGLQSKIISRPGINGLAIKEDAYRGELASITCQRPNATASLLRSSNIQMKAMEGRLVYLYDSAQNYWSNVFLKKVRILPHQYRGLSLVEGTTFTRCWWQPYDLTVILPWEGVVEL